MKITPKILTAVLLLFLVASCTESKIEQGQVTYELTYPHMDPENTLVNAISPKEMTIVFKGTKMKTTIKKGRLFETNIISDESNNSLALYSDLDGNQIYCVLNDEDVEKLKNSLPTYTAKTTEVQDSIGGIYSTKYTTSSSDSLQPSDAWFTDDFAPQDAVWFSPYKGVKGFPVVYDIERYGMFTHATATNFVEREVKDEEFEIEGKYRLLTFEEYEEESFELFDILLNW
ncbi:MAG: hypothetical protein MK078_03365 [Crocinitomicaceae bacterium]|nr:hypothetical protein [Crocinitomicaceae bacterium]